MRDCISGFAVKRYRKIVKGSVQDDVIDTFVSLTWIDQGTSLFISAEAVFI